MDHDTREAVGQLSRWCVLGGAVLGAVIAGVAVLGAVEATVRAGRARVVIGDGVSRVHPYVFLPVISRPQLDRGIPGYYWEDRQGRLSELKVTRKGIAYLRPSEDVGPGRLDLHTVANPYSAHAPGWGSAAMFLYPGETHLVVVDTRAVLTAADDRPGRRAQGGGGRRARRPQTPGTFRLADDPGALWLARLAEARPLAYLAPVPLDVYDACRHVLRQGPSAAVLPASDTWERPADVEAMVETLVFVRRRLRHRLTLVTTDDDLADAARGRRIPVVRVGADEAAVRHGVNVPDWAAAYDWLADQTP
ncbi:MAG: hypothetical protein ACOC7R_04655 [Planctomycetota bacterium]